AGLDVTYVQNVTDIDDPLLERAAETGVDWRDLAEDQVDLFRGDMRALRVVPPEHFVGVVESMELVVAAVAKLLEAGAAYWVDQDIYADLGADPRFGTISHLDEQEMRELFPERGGDPDRAGKRDPLDPLLWRGRREGEPAWDGGALGPGRPGWHIECGAIAAHYLGLPVSVEGGGQDLIFPHHDMGTSHLRFLAGGPGPAREETNNVQAMADEPIRCYLHTGLVAYQGEKMSKSLGNLVFVSTLLDEGVDARAIRLVLLNHHYRQEWEYTESELRTAQQRLQRWQAAAQHAGSSQGSAATAPEAASHTPGADSAVSDPAGSPTPGADEAREEETIRRMRQALAADLDTVTCLQVVDDAAARGPLGDAVVTAIDALLGIDLRS
ncbi:MAG TPA: hypothetical protein VK086_01305, partial [Ruania sp.]|nr:hypothetical protein [Ruania sp.]